MKSGMPAKTIVTRTRRADTASTKEFPFTQEMLPVLSENGDLPLFVKDYSLRSWKVFQNLPFPSITDEAWRRTDIRGLDPASFQIPSKNELEKLPGPPNEFLEPLVSDQNGGQILIGAGRNQIYLNPELVRKGVIFTDLHTAYHSYPQILERILGKVVRPEEGKFSSLAAAFSSNGVLVYVPKGVQVEQPLHSLLWGPGSGFAYLSHLLVMVDDGASLTYLHESASHTISEGNTLHAGIVEIHVGARANLRFIELQSWGEHVWNFSHERARVESDGNLDWIFGAVGSQVTKNFSDLDLVGEGATGRMSGFYFTDGKQHLDHDTQQNHLAPHTTSDLLFKGALKDRSRSVWQGMIYVAPGAQKTDGYQANRNLVLSPKARADSIPGLEILADDVRCTHGATVGKIDKDQIYYLRSRGIPYREAERLIVEGFFDPIMQRIPYEGVRTRFQQSIMDKMR
jgi:Fe-S cluster assembly protein SufD